MIPAKGNPAKGVPAHGNKPLAQSGKKPRAKKVKPDASE